MRTHPAVVKGDQAILYIFSGLPGSGKSTLSQRVATEFSAVYLRIDSIEQGLRDLCAIQVQSEGYRLGYRMATDNLRLGLAVVADSCNPIELTRREWEKVARDAQVHFTNIEVICSDRSEHRQRVERRVADIPGLRLPSWKEVASREYHEWTGNRIIIDTAGRPQVECESELLFKLAGLSA